MFAWHVAVTKPFGELQAERHLENQQFQAFNPKAMIQRIVRNRKITVEQPYIPGYIFIRFDADDRSWLAINNTRGVHQLLYAAPEVPAVVRQDAMDILLDRCSGGCYVGAEFIDTELSKLIPVGVDVQITTGPFEGHNGTVHWSQHERVSVVLSFLGHPRKIAFPANAVAVLR